MAFWHNLEQLRSVSHVCTWATMVFAILAAASTGLRFYVDRRAGHLSSDLQKQRIERMEEDNSVRENELKSRISSLQAVVPPRTITPLQRDLLLEALLDKANTSPRPTVHIILTGSELESLHFASKLRSLLTEAGYQEKEYEFIARNDIRIVPKGGGQKRKPDLLAVFSSETSDIPSPSLPKFGHIMMMNPTPFSIERGDKSHPRVYRYTKDPNDIMYGMAALLRFVGFRVDPISSKGILPYGQIGILIPTQVD